MYILGISPHNWKYNRHEPDELLDIQRSAGKSPITTCLSFYPAMPFCQPILTQPPDLPPSTGPPWSADVVQAHRGLHAGFKASQAALNLDKSDPIRLGHHLQHAKTVMVPVIEALGRQKTNPLPLAYMEGVEEAVLALVDALQSALAESTAA